jgi:glyoxylase-like metal-dependent hydrolase (beta-lactamase superfamily II)/8-oxo-dGTP pyrophosphatase MutT (NUDIX family)
MPSADLTPSSPITEAASVLLTAAPGSQDVFLVGRSPALRFMGGFHAFPGGKVHRSDAALATQPGVTAYHVAAVRELFEETGVLLARQADGTSPATGPALVEARQELLAERVGFAEVLGRLGLHLRHQDLLPAGHLVTPPFVPLRFDTAFFVASLPPGQAAEIWPGELTEGQWASASQALQSWRAGKLLLSPPTLTLLELIEGCRAEGLPERLRPVLADLDAGALPDIWFSPGVQMIPLFSDGLPPSTHTNAWLVGTGPVYLIDPGPSAAAEQEKLFRALDAQAAVGRRLDAIVLTHHHPDHIGAVNACARRYEVPVRGHPLTARALHGRIDVRGDLLDGDQLDLGPCPDGRGRWRLFALHTPGHAPGHLAFYEPHYQLLITGDMVSMLSSVVIAPPEGDVSIYLESLRRLRDLPVRLLLPSHGGASARPGVVLDEYIGHRLERQRALLASLAPGPRTVPELALEIYRGLPAVVMRFAELQVLAGLQRLRHQGKVAPVATPTGGAWQRTIPHS